MRFLRPFTAIAALIVLAASCKKDSNTVDTTPIFYFVNGGISGFDQNLILFQSEDTLTHNMIISSSYLLPKETIIKLAIEDSARINYNLINSKNYQLMPSTAYSFATSITAAAGSYYDTIPLKLNKQFLSSADYMLPIIITSVSQYKLDTSTRLLYIHTSGNTMAGLYTSSIFKTSYIGDSANNNVSDTASFFITKAMTPTSSSQALLDYAELGANGWKYQLSYANGIFSIEANDVIKNSVQPNSFEIIKATFDPVTKDMYIKSSYKNLSGNQRIVTESLTLQQ